MSTLRLNIFKTAAPIQIRFCLHSYICLSYSNPSFQVKIPIFKKWHFFQISPTSIPPFVTSLTISITTLVIISFTVYCINSNSSAPARVIAKNNLSIGQSFSNSNLQSPISNQRCVLCLHHVHCHCYYYYQVMHYDYDYYTGN